MLRAANCWFGPLAFFATLTLACSTKAPNKQLTPKACTKFGEQCEVSPGKLGSCVVRDNCSGKDCLVCQQQH